MPRAVQGGVVPAADRCRGVETSVGIRPLALGRARRANRRRAAAAMPPAEEQKLHGVSWDPKRQSYKARVHYKGKERYIARYQQARDAGLAYDQVVRAINSSGSSSSRRRALNFPDIVPNDPAIRARAAQILMAPAAAADSSGSEGSDGLEEDKEQQHMQAGAAAAGAAAAGGGVLATGPQQQQPGLSAQPSGSARDFLDSDEFECLLDFLGCSSDALGAAAAAPAASYAASYGMHGSSGCAAPVAPVQQPRQAGQAAVLMAAPGSTHWGSPAAGSSSSHADALRAVTGAQHCIVDLHAAVLMHPDPLGYAAVFAVSAQQQAHSDAAKLLAAALLQRLAAAVQTFGPGSGLDARTFVLSLLVQLHRALSSLQVMVAVRGSEASFDMRAVLSQWAAHAAGPASRCGAGAAVDAAVAHLVQQL